MTYAQALSFLDSRIDLGWKLGLESMRQMLAELGNPEKRLCFVHIAGTNGKGSTAAMLESVARSAGYRTGLYTSPHLIDLRERIRINGEMISEPQLAEVIERIQSPVEKYQATYFETLTAAALLFFAQKQAEIVMLEVGLGGRLDATNVVTPEVSVITSISYDHMTFLGETLGEIAAEKAGIVKPGVPCVVGELPEEAHKVIERVCRDRRAPIKHAAMFAVTIIEHSADKLLLELDGDSPFAVTVRTPLVGRHQAINVAIAATVCDTLNRSGWRISPSNFQHGLCSTCWPGRFDKICRQPPVIADVAHNPAAVAELMILLKTFYADFNKVIVIGLMKDKESREIARQVAAVADVIQPVEPDTERALSAVELKRRFEGLQVTVREPMTVAQGVASALRNADANTVVCITGSHYVVGEALTEIKTLTT